MQPTYVRVCINSSKFSSFRLGFEGLSFVSRVWSSTSINIHLLNKRLFPARQNLGKLSLWCGRKNSWASPAHTFYASIDLKSSVECQLFLRLPPLAAHSHPRWDADVAVFRTAPSRPFGRTSSARFWPLLCAVLTVAFWPGHLIWRCLPGSCNIVSLFGRRGAAFIAATDSMTARLLCNVV